MTAVQVNIYSTLEIKVFQMFFTQSLLLGILLYTEDDFSNVHMGSEDDTASDANAQHDPSNIQDGAQHETATDGDAEHDPANVHEGADEETAKGQTASDGNAQDDLQHVQGNNEDGTAQNDSATDENCKVSEDHNTTDMEVDVEGDTQDAGNLHLFCLKVQLYILGMHLSTCTMERNMQEYAPIQAKGNSARTHPPLLLFTSSTK